MFLLIAGGLIAAWLLFSGWKFYRSIDWAEKPQARPDLQAMHKRQAELQHIEDVLEQACAAGKLARSTVDDFLKFSEAEIAVMRAVEADWQHRRKQN
jgi:hypothetical protein